MRFHRHQTGRTVRWHSVRMRHDEVWDWCAHHEEVERYLHRRRRLTVSLSRDKSLRLQAAG